jgi:hypothetical protein
MKQTVTYVMRLQGYFKNNTVRQYVLLLAILLLGFFVPFIALIVAVAVSYKLLLLLLNHRIFDSKFFVFVVSLFFYILVLQAVILISWLFSHNFPLTACGPLTAVVLIGLYYSIKPTFTKKNLKQRDEFTTAKIKDVVPLIVCLFAFVAFVAFPMHHSGSNELSGVTVLINRVIDDPNHLGMLNDKLQFNRGVITDSSAEGHTNTKGVSFYPAGWHSANAVIIKAFYPGISTGAESLVAYAITKVFWFLFLIYIFVRTIFSLYIVYSKEKLSPAVASWIGLASLLFTGWFLIDPFLDGFYSFLPQLIIVPLFILSLIQMSLLGKDDRSALLNSLILPALLCMGAALSWLLLLPVFVGAFLLYSLTLLHTWGIIKTLKALKKNRPLRYVVILALTIVPVIVQIITSKGTGESVSFIEGIMLPGPIQTYPISFYNFVLLGLGLFIVFAIKNAKVDKLQPILAYILAIIGFTTVLYLLQLYISQANFYYYFKSLNAFTVAASMLCVVGFGFFIRWIESKASRSTALIVSFVLILLAIQFVYTKPLLFLYMEGSRATTVSINQDIFKLLETNYSQSHYYNKEVTIFYPDNNPNLNEVASRLLSVNKPYGVCYDAVKGASFSTPPKDFSVAPILQSCDDPDIKITYYVEQDSIETMQKTIDNNTLQNKVTLRLLR